MIGFLWTRVQLVTKTANGLSVELGPTAQVQARRSKGPQGSSMMRKQC